MHSLIGMVTASMRRLVLAFALVAVSWSAMAAEANDPFVCRRDSVLDRVSALLRQAGRPMALDRNTVGEHSAGSGRLISCAIEGHLLGYETKIDGIHPVDTVFVVRYSLELRQNGIFLRIE